MTFGEAREMILASLYENVRSSRGEVAERQFLGGLVGDGDDAVARAVLADLIQNGMVDRSESGIRLTVRGCYEAEQVISAAEYPKPEKAANHIAIYSLAAGIYVTLFLAGAAYFDNTINNGCMVEGAIA